MCVWRIVHWFLLTLDGKYVVKPQDQRAVQAIRTSYRTSSTYRALHNQIKNDSNVSWLIIIKKSERGSSGERAKTKPTHIGEPKTTIVTTLNESSEYITKKDNPNQLSEGKMLVGAMANEAQHVIEQSALTSIGDWFSYLKNLISGEDGTACTDEAKKAESEARSQYSENTEEDTNYEQMSDEDLDKILFTENNAGGDHGN